MKYLVVFEQGESSWGVHIPDLPGCVALGKSREEAVSLIREAIELPIESLTEHGDPVPPPRSESEVVEAPVA